MSDDYDKTYNLCIDHGNWCESRYVDTLDEVREIAKRHKVDFVDKGYADYRYPDDPDGPIEVIRRTTGSVNRHVWAS